VSRRAILQQVALLAASTTAAAATIISPLAAYSEEEAAPLTILNGVVPMTTTEQPSSVSVPDTENNDFIQMLKARSDANRNANAKEATRKDKLSFSDFRDQYQKPSFKGVRQPNGDIKMYLLEELEALQVAGKIKVENGVKYDKKGNAKADYSQQVYVLVQ
jgi:hypothetical protein